MDIVDKNNNLIAECEIIKTKEYPEFVILKDRTYLLIRELLLDNKSSIKEIVNFAKKMKINEIDIQINNMSKIIGFREVFTNMTFDVTNNQFHVKEENIYDYIEEDNNKLTEMKSELDKIHRELEPDLFVEPKIKENFKAKGVVFTFKEGEDIKGYIDMSIDDKQGYIESLFVNKDSRNKNIAKKLLNKIKQYASENNIETLELDVYKNKPALNFYKKSGFISKGQKITLKINKIRKNKILI